MSVMKESFGKTKDGKETFKFSLTNETGMKVCVSDFGAVITEIHVPDAKGNDADVVLGGDQVSQYEDNKGYLGACVGRSANRIAKATFAINGKEYHVPVNENENNLHSGPDVYNERIWTVVEAGEDDMGSFVTFALHSPDLDQGYPGNLDITVTYIVSNKENSLMIHYNGICDEDTVVNLTNHSYFNLAGHNSGLITDHIVWVDADYFTEADDEAIPTGKLIDVTGTPMDFRKPKTVSEDIGKEDYTPIKYGGGYDHNYCLNTYNTKADGKQKVSKCASLEDPKSGRIMEVYTDLPGMQLYSGNFLKGNFTGKENTTYQNRTGICFETQYFPNSVNEPSFPSPVLKKGEEYDTTTVYTFKNR